MSDQSAYSSSIIVGAQRARFERRVFTEETSLFSFPPSPSLPLGTIALLARNIDLARVRCWAKRAEKGYNTYICRCRQISRDCARFVLERERERERVRGGGRGRGSISHARRSGAHRRREFSFGAEPPSESNTNREPLLEERRCTTHGRALDSTGRNFFN